MREFIIDGAKFSTLEGFYTEIRSELVPGVSWEGNLDAFDDLLRGGFGTPESGFVLIWKNSEMSRARLGFQEAARQLADRLGRCHPGGREQIEQQLRDARNEIGQTVFDWLVKIIQDHGAGGCQSEDNVVLRLE